MEQGRVSRQQCSALNRFEEDVRLILDVIVVPFG